MYDLIVLGGGPAGITAALRGRELGASVALIEKERLGGTCTNDGCVPTRVLAKAARLLRDTEQFRMYGLHTSPPELEFSDLISRTQAVVYQIHEKKQMVHHLKTAGVYLLHGVGEVCFADEHTLRLQDGTCLQANKFILCTGGHARRLDFPGAEYTLSHKDIWSLTALPSRVAIVGAAATGCQIASVLNAFGVQVTLLERSPRILRAEDVDVSAVISQVFERRGIGMVLDLETIDRVEKVLDGYQLVYRKAGAEQHLEVDSVVLSSGWLGNVSTLNLEAVGVKHERNYVLVDEYLRTSAEHIFAAGDVNGKMMLVPSAGVEGRIAAENAVLGVGQRVDHTIIPHGGFTDPEYGSVGLTEEQAAEAGDYIAASVPYTDLDRAVIDGHTEGLCKLIVSPETHRILGAHIVGEQALETVQLVAAGMTAQIWVEQLAEMELAYPTFTAVVGLAARKVAHQLGVIPITAEWRSLDRPHAEWEQNPFPGGLA
jgi:pyruvate/2-oxoglutarate dehydrogenase complex dihydrolipoamide dehydrogenase (E3) component